MRKPRLAIDMDEVIADAHGALAAWQAETYGYTNTDLLDYALDSRVSPEHLNAMKKYLMQGEAFRHFAVMPDAKQAVKRLMSRFEIFIVTAAMEYPSSCAFKFAWLAEHFPFISPLNIVFCGDKSIVAADFLLDDSERHFSRFQGQGVLFSAPHNQISSWPVKVKDWHDAVVYLEGRISRSA
jgi:5'(3')-deoxyribonucleotidase